MKLSSPLFSALLASTLALAAHAQDASEEPAYKGGPPRTIKVKARTNPGDLPYWWVFDNQERLQSYLPAGPRMVDLSWRITFRELSLAEQDAWAPKGWAVALVGDGLEQDLQVARGGYFLLPVLPKGGRAATIMFREQSLPGYIGAAWRVRVGAEQRLSLAAIQQAMDEIQGVQRSIPETHVGLKLVRTGKYDAIKACFLASGGSVLVDGTPAADVTIGNCAVLKFDSLKAAGSQAIEFKGPLDIVTVVESEDYRTRQDLPALGAGQAAAFGRDAAGPDAAAGNTAPTNLSNLSYEWNIKRQLRLQGARSPQADLVDFVWRLSLDGLSEAEQDSWTPQGWALALAGKDYAHAVPVARGGYFLLPALPPGRQDANLVFKEKDKRNLVDAAWVVRLRDGQRPYLYYGEIKEAMEKVRKAQDAVPDGNTELSALRAAHYDGLKACFLDADNTVFVGDYPTADATVGSCRILKFDPAKDINEKVEFIGKVDAVTVVDTARYLTAKG
jgi:hypothetical protein